MARAARMEDALAPVRNSLMLAARDDAAAIRARAGREAASLRAQGEQQARTRVDRTRAIGARAAATVAAGRQAAARRRARQIVLDAHRQAIGEVRTEAIRRLDARIGAPAGAPLRHRLTALVEQATGGPALEAPPTAGEWAVTARGGRLAASVGVTWLVDQAMASFDGEMDSLWR